MELIVRTTKYFSTGDIIALKRQHLTNNGVGGLRTASAEQIEELFQERFGPALVLDDETEVPKESVISGWGQESYG